MDDDEIEPTIEEDLKSITSHIDILLDVSKNLDLEKIIKKFNTKIKKYDNFPYFKGAEIEVVKCEQGSSLNDWKNSQIARHPYRIFTPCPSRYPELLSGLIFTIQEDANYLFYINKYEWYENIALSAQKLEERNTNLAKEEVCRYIIFEQIRLLNVWRNRLLEELENEEPTLYEKGWKLYFAFGRNVNQKIMRTSNPPNKRRCPNAQLLGPAYLENHRFLIDKKGYASVKPNNGSTVPGALWAVSPEDFKNLDLREGIRVGSYRKEDTFVQIPTGPDLEAKIYISNRPEGKIAAEGYIEEIIEGLEALGINHTEYYDYKKHIQE